METTTTDAPPMLAFENVTKTFGEQTAVDDVTIDVPTGTTTALIGSSGCGKSTLLRMLVGLEHPTRGHVRVDGVDVTPRTLGHIRSRIGYVIQEGGLFPHLTARENVALAARPHGWTMGRVEARLDPLVELTHFPPDGLDRYPGELSGGQRQRVSLMRALLTEPEALLMDDPFGALDPMVRHELQREFRDIVKETGKTALIVTHDLVEAGYLGDDVVLMNKGRVVQQGPFRKLLEAPASDFVRRFVEAQRAPGDGGAS